MNGSGGFFYANCKRENTLSIQNLMSNITYSKVVQWARLESLLGRLWPSGHRFDTPALEHAVQTSFFFRCLTAANISD